MAISKKKKIQIQRLIRQAKEAGEFKTSRFANPCSVPQDTKNPPYPANESEVDAFINERTEVYRRSWIIAPLNELMKMIEEL